jgi:hypothetical protein
MCCPDIPYNGICPIINISWNSNSIHSLIT